jgi:hypothetical protein
VAEFETWRELSDANFPTFEGDPDEPLADHRTDAERKHDRARALADTLGEQGALFPRDSFEPVTTTLKELAEYAAEMAELTERFSRRDESRRLYLESLIEAVDGDMSATWQDAHDRAFEEPVSGGAE